MTDLPSLIVRRLETARTRADRSELVLDGKRSRKLRNGARRARRQALRLTAEYFGVGEPVPWVRRVRWAPGYVCYHDARARTYYVRSGSTMSWFWETEF